MNEEIKIDQEVVYLDLDHDIYYEWSCKECDTWNSELRYHCRQEGCLGVKDYDAKAWR